MKTFPKKGKQKIAFKKRKVELGKRQNSIFKDPLLTRQEVADYFKVTKTCIFLWGKNGILNPLRCANRVYYRQSEILSVAKSIFNNKNKQDDR